MPAGVSTLNYICFTVSSFVCLMIGSHVVHTKYNPLHDLDKYVEKELLNHPPEVGEKVRARLKDLLGKNTV